jgi:hypothetical protein
MCLHTEGKLTETEDTEIQHIMFQRKSLSPLQFCISLSPLKEQLNKLNTGYEEHTTKTKVLHIPYVDNLKLIGNIGEEL